MVNGFLQPPNYVDPTPRPVPLWGKRADRTYLNAVETFAPFTALVIVAHLAGKSNSMTAFWAMSFFWLRLAHAVVYLLAIPYVRTLIFTLGFVCVAGIFWEVINQLREGSDAPPPPRGEGRCLASAHHFAGRNVLPLA